MINRCILIIVGVLCFYSLEAKKIEGEILYTNDTIKVTFDIPIYAFGKIMYEMVQYSIIYYDSLNNKMRIQADSAKEIRFTYGTENVRMLSKPTPVKMLSLRPYNNIFLKLEMDGYIKIFKYYHTKTMTNYSKDRISTGSTSMYGTESFYIQKGEGKLNLLNKFVYRKELFKYFNDCPDLVKKIENKEFRKKDIKSIIIYYNTKCVK